MELIGINARLTYFPGADPEILEEGGALCRPSWLAGEENFGFQMA